MAYAPAGNLTTTGTLTHLATVFYKRTALDQLRKVFRFYNVCEPDSLPLRNGKTVQWYRYSLLAANTTPSTEGAVSSSGALTTTTVSASVQEFSAFITVSTLLKDTAIDPIVENASSNLGYSAGLSVDTLSRAEFDTNSAGELDPVGATATAYDVRRVVAILKNADVHPRKSGNFVGILHPFISADLKSDNTAGGFIDASRYARPEQFLNGEIGMIENVKLIESTNVKTSGSAPNVLYWFYIVGDGAVGAVDLEGSGPSKITDPSKESFSINVIQGKPQMADPEGMIGAAVSYRYVYAVKTLDATVLRFRMLRCDASLV